MGTMRLRFWLGLVAVVARSRSARSSAAWSSTPAKATTSSERSATRRQRSAHQAQALAALSVGQLATRRGLLPGRGQLQPARVRRRRRPLLSRGVSAGPASSSAVPRAERSALRARARLPDHRTRPGRPAAQGRQPRPSTSRSSTPPTPAASGAAARLRRRRRPAARALPAPRSRQRQAGRDLGHAPAGGRHRDQRLPSRLPGRRADRDGGGAAQRPGRLRRRRVPRRRPRGGRDLGRPQRRRWCSSGRAAGPCSGPTARSTTPPPRRSRSPTAPGCWSSAIPAGPVSSLPIADGRGRDLPGRAARGADPGLEPQRAHAGAAEPGLPGLADRPQEPAPLRGGPAHRDGARAVATGPRRPC